MTDTADRVSHETLDEALYAIRQEVGVLPRNGTNPHFGSRFTTIDKLVEIAEPIAWKHGVLVRHQLNLNGLRHELWFNGERAEVYDIDLPNPQGTAQGLGSSITYLKRYDIGTSLGVVSEGDDDGSAASAKAAAIASHPASRPSPLKSVTNDDTHQITQAVTAMFPGAQEIDREF